MTTNKTIELEIEVPGTPEEVWESIATGHGITTWFVPAEVEERVGGEVKLDFGPGMGVATGEVTVWDAPRRFVYVASSDKGRRLAYELLVEAGSGGTCVVRLVNSGFLDEADWQAEYDGTYEGWKLFLYLLKLVRTHFPGQRCTSIMVNGMTEQPIAEAWRVLATSLGLPEQPALGQHVDAAVNNGPSMSGTVERFTAHLLTVLLDQPTGGICVLGAEGFGEQVVMTAYLYLFGDQAPAVVERDEPGWRAWMTSNFTSTGAPA